MGHAAMLQRKAISEPLRTLVGLLFGAALQDGQRPALMLEPDVEQLRQAA